MVSTPPSPPPPHTHTPTHFSGGGGQELREVTKGLVVSLMMLLKKLVLHSTNYMTVSI